MAAPRPLTVGTAGHVDHGKTVLVEALTGRNTDRLPEEHRRGLSIELGFAELELGNRRLSLVDVPGHERFIRTMVAGATGIDLFLMVIAADDGVMPQTQEHCAVLQALGIEQGVVALTKCDLVDEAKRHKARKEAAELIPGTPVVGVSAPRGDGIEKLKQVIEEAATRVDGLPDHRDHGRRPVALHIDRVFTIAGRGTVVTGTLWSGIVRQGDRVVLLPSQCEARVRDVQVHDRQTAAATSRQRVAINLAGVSHDEVQRGEVVTSPNSDLGPTYRLDVELRCDHLPDRPRVQIHHGMRATAGRFVGLGDGMAQLRLEAPLIARPGDRVVIRRISPPGTWGGGKIVDAHPRRHGPGADVEVLKLIQLADPDEILETVLRASPGGIPTDRHSWAKIPLLGAAINRFPEERWRETVARLISSERAAAQNGLLTARTKSAATMSSPVPDPADSALDDQRLDVLDVFAADGLMPRQPQAIAKTLGTGPGDVQVAIESLVASGDLTFVKPGIYYESRQLAAVCRQIVELMRRVGPITIAGLRDELVITRKYAQALLEYMDRERITLRHEDEHQLRRAYASK